MKKRARVTKGGRKALPKTVGGKVGGGPVMGVPASPAAAAAARTNAWKHGRYAKTVTELEVRAAEVGKLRKDAPEIIEAFTRAIAGGDMDALNPVAVAGMAETEILRRDVFDHVTAHGVMLEEELMDSEGNVKGSRLRTHPGLQEMRWMNEQLGHTATDLQISKKSRDDGAMGQAAALMLRRTAALRAADKSLLPAPDRALLGKGAGA